MLSVSVFLLVSILTIVIAYVWLRPNHPKDLPPVPYKPYPILGHLLEMQGTLPIHVFYKWKKQLGDIYSVYLGSQLFIVTSTYDLMKEMLRKKEECFYERMELYAMSFLRCSDGTNRLIDNQWKDIRRATLTILKDFGMGKELMAEKITQEVQAYLKELENRKGKASDVRKLLDSAITNVIISVLVGHRYEYTDPLYLKIITMLHDLLGILKTVAILDTFSLLKYMPGDCFRARELKHQMETYTKFFSDHNIRIKNEGDNTEQDNFIRAYHREINKFTRDGQAHTLRDEDIPSLGFTLLFAGSDSTSMTISWNIVMAMNYPDMQTKMYEEIKHVVGTDRLPSTHDRKRLNYVNAFIAETQRFRNILPIIMPRVCSTPTTLGGFPIPKGAYVTCMNEAISSDEKLWGDPQAFRPERFLDANGQYFSPEFHLPFSSGKRSCVGEALAVMELFLFISATFQRYEAVPEDPKNPPTIEPDYTLACAPQPFLVRFVERVKE